MTEAADVLKSRIAIAPRVALILGSGLGPVADEVQDPVVVPYDDLPGFPRTGVVGHAGRLVAGTIAGTPVLVLQGRAHYYEYGRPDVMRPVIETLKSLGCDTVVLTNAAGSLRTEVPPGSVSVIADHINFTGQSPLFNQPGSQRFVNMKDAYDPALRAQIQAIAARQGLTLPEGVYWWAGGPQFETPAEIRAIRTLGGDLVGMSTVPEVILCRFFGIRVAALSIVTNLGAGLSAEVLSHEHTIRSANLGFEAMRRLLLGFIEDFSAVAETTV